jgi:hypothetical protein
MLPQLLLHGFCTTEIAELAQGGDCSLPVVKAHQAKKSQQQDH